MTYILDFRKCDTGGSVKKGHLKLMPGGPEWTEAENRLALESKVTFLIHGFNVNRQKGQERLSNLAQFLSSADDGAILAVLWPGDHWTRFLSYSFEGRDADESAAELYDFIDRVIPKGTTLSFVTHSLGARVALETIKRVPKANYQISQVCLMAAAIDNYSLAGVDDYRLEVEQTDRVSVLSSDKDQVLRLAYPAGDLLQSFLFWRDTAGLALGYRGPVPSDGDNGTVPSNVLHRPIPSVRNAKHGDYVPSFGPGHQPTTESERNQKSAAQFANEILAGRETPGYT